MAHPNPFDYFAIKNTIGRYCIALDTKDFDSLEHIFDRNADGIYPFTVMHGVVEIARAIEGRLKHVTSQHALTTQVIEVEDDGVSATATTYFTAVHFGKGKWQGQKVTAWGTYEDQMILVPNSLSLSGSSGLWVIKRREVKFMGRLGEERILEGE